eukprot:6214763-Pleurochrysis_carterae.AAC.7
MLSSGKACPLRARVAAASRAQQHVCVNACCQREWPRTAALASVHTLDVLCACVPRVCAVVLPTVCGWLHPSFHARRIADVGRHVELTVDERALVHACYIRGPSPALSNHLLAPPPSLSRRSVAPPIRQHLPPNSSGSRPHAPAMRRASLREVAVIHAAAPSSSVKKGVVLPCPAVRSATGTLRSRVTHAARSASYAHRGSAPTGSLFCLLRTSIGVALSRAC